MLSSRTAAGKGRQRVSVPVVLVAGEGPDEDLGTWRRAAATACRPPSRRQEGETEREGGRECAHWAGEREKPACTAYRQSPGWVRDSVSAWTLEGGAALGPLCQGTNRLSLSQPEGMHYLVAGLGSVSDFFIVRPCLVGKLKRFWTL